MFLYATLLRSSCSGALERLATVGCMMWSHVLRRAAGSARSLRLRHVQGSEAHASACSAAEAAAAEQQRYFCNTVDVLQPNLTSLALAERNVTVRGKTFSMTVHAQASSHCSAESLSFGYLQYEEEAQRLCYVPASSGGGLKLCVLSSRNDCRRSKKTSLWLRKFAG